MFILIAVVIALVFSVIASLCFNDHEKQQRAAINCLMIICVAIVACGYFDQRGIFGDPHSLDRAAHYRVLSVTPIDEKSTVVILRDGDDKIVPIKFQTQVNADTDGFYSVVGENWKNYNLAPVK